MTLPEPERVQIGGERFYKFDKGNYPSVTTVLNAYAPKKEAIEKANVPKEYVDYAALRGTMAHHRILNPYAIRSLPLPELDHEILARWGKTIDDLVTDVETCIAMWEQLDFEIANDAHIEQRIVSHEHEYAGTLDALTDGTVVDLKTSKGAFDSHKLQAAAYFHACLELPELPDPEDAAIIVLHPDPETNTHLTGHVEWMSREQVDHWFGEFCRVLSKYNTQSKII